MAKLKGGTIVYGPISATSFTSTSDRSQKTDITPIENGLELVEKIRGVRYKLLNDDKVLVGVIAQEIEEVLPEVVNSNDDGIKSVSYGNIVGVLVEAIKQQQEQINTLKREIELLKK